MTSNILDRLVLIIVWMISFYGVNPALSQERRHIDGIEYYDSIKVFQGDSIRIPIIQNTKMGVEIIGNKWEAEELLKEPVSTDGWQVYKDTKLGISFLYPSMFYVKQESGDKDTVILLFDKEYSKKRKSSEQNLGIELWITLGNHTFEEIAESRGFALVENDWYTEGRVPIGATLFRGSGWLGLIGENAYGANINDSIFGLAYEQLAFAFKSLKPYSSAVFDFNNLDLRIVVAIISSLQLLDQLHPSVSDWKESVIIGKSKNLLIRIDKTEKGLRYVCWSGGHSKSEKPDLILFNGVEIFKDTSCVRSWTFKNNEWSYIVEQSEVHNHAEHSSLFLRLLYNGIEKQKIILTQVK